MARTRREYRQASRETYRRWKDANPKEDLTYVEFQQIVYAFNYAFRDYLLETGERAKLPWGIGDFAISKKKRRVYKINAETGKEMIVLPVDWKKTRELGYKVHHLNRHTDGMVFKVKWFISTARFKMPVIWAFKPNRITSRLITHYIKKDPKNQYKYQEWHLVE